MRAHRGDVAFTVAVAALLVVGAGVMAIVLHAAGAPKAIAIGLVLAALPVGPLIAVYLWLDRYEPEPRSLLLLGLGWGAFVATSAALFLQAFDAFAFGTSEARQSVLVAPTTEEAAKGLFVVLLLVFRRAELDGILDGIVYAGMVGIGFAFTENILYLSHAYIGTGAHAGSIEDAVGLFVVRGVLSPFAHPLFTAFVGVGAGIAVSSRSRIVQVVAPAGGYVLAVAAHASWNAGMLLDHGRGAVATYILLMVPAFVAIACLAIWARRREGVLLATSLTDCARLGYLEPFEVPWLARIPGRRACRAFAREHGGPVALDAMRGYQTAAVELGFLHHRHLRGTAPRNYARLGQEYVLRLAELRPQLVWPRNGRTVGIAG
jgi:RsiW-degrading membrane proteinase PrsW (M82 family)